MNIYAIYGASGFGREVIPLARSYLENKVAEFKLVFVDDSCDQKQINGYDVMRLDDFANARYDKKFISIAIADSKIREQLSIKCSILGINYFDVAADNFMQLDSNLIGVGAILCPFSMLTSNATIGMHFHLNIYSYVAHDCVVGDFVTFAPSVQCNGNVIIEDHAYIGTGAIIKQGSPSNPIVIGKGAIVGAGAVVTKSVPAGITVVGNPARELIKG
jgi:sugar O-acyltransferase (sialic acid O-acetyltransferase NeuD family)